MPDWCLVYIIMWHYFGKIYIYQPVYVWSIAQMLTFKMLTYAYPSTSACARPLHLIFMISFLILDLWFFFTLEDDAKFAGILLQGMPFRTSHDVVGRSVALCVSRNCQLQDLTLYELRTITPVFDEDVYKFLGVENSIKKFRSYGSTGTACVADQLKYWITQLSISKESSK